MVKVLAACKKGASEEAAEHCCKDDDDFDVFHNFVFPSFFIVFCPVDGCFNDA